MEWELTFIKWLRTTSNEVSNILAEMITILGEQYILIVILAFIYFVYNKKVGEQIAYCVFIGVCSNNALKGLVNRVRPFEADVTIIPARMETATGYSFPSGHTQNASTFYGAIGLHFKNKKLWIAIITIIILIACSRVYLGVHYPTDVIGGALLGIAGAFLGTWLYQKWGTNFKHKMILLVATALVFLPFTIIYYRPNFSDIEVYRDFYTGYALFLGFIGAVFVENKWVDFTCQTSLKRRLIRFGLSLVVFAGLLMGLDKLFPEGYIFLDMLRYGLVSFVGMGLYPMLFKPLHLN
ncbi:MAG: phosphatase PAP2 family protein [Bacilli bacterium]